MRLFVGVFPPEVVRRDVAATLATAPRGPRLRWTAWEKLHVTLAFLGDVPPARVGEIRSAVDAAAATTRPFPAEIHGLGGFPDRRRPRVLFLELTAGGEEFGALARSLHAALPADLRPSSGSSFHPHLTLARPRRPIPAGELEELEHELAAWRWRFEATEIALVRSELDPAGARYEALHVTGLAGAQG